MRVQVWRAPYVESTAGNIRNLQWEELNGLTFLLLFDMTSFCDINILMNNVTQKRFL